jgi:hypothetical protein
MLAKRPPLALFQVQATTELDRCTHAHLDIQPMGASLQANQ